MLAARSAIWFPVEISPAEGKLPSAMTQNIEMLGSVSTASRMAEQPLLCEWSFGKTGQTETFNVEVHHPRVTPPVPTRPG